jgi:D-3-phosphoglycerate dehydrogenase
MSTPPAHGRIAIDLDGVLTEHPAPLAIASNERFGLDLPERAFIDSAGLNVPIEVREWVYSDAGPAARLEPCPGGAEFLRQVLTLFGTANVLILTARPESASGMTAAWLERHGFPQPRMIFADDKMTHARLNDCRFAVEDSERHALNYAAGGIRCFLIDPSRHAHLDDEPSIIQVDGFDDILAYLRRVVDPRQAVAAALPPVDANGLQETPIIVVSDAIHPVARDLLASSSTLVDVDGTDTAALMVALPHADALVVRSETQVTADVLAAGPRLRVVARAGVGVDNIDLAAATKAGVLVLNAPGANAVSAGEHTVAVLLALARQLPHANQSTHAGRWERRQIRPFDLNGRTVGIIGLGRVGSVVAKRLHAFGMRIVAHDPYVPTARFADLHAESMSVADVYRQADVLTFHVPSTDQTRNMLDARTIGQLKQGAIVLNMARGDVVDQDALAAAVRSGQLAGAGVDVFPVEPCTASPLFGLPNVIVTPHTAGSSAEALEAVGRVIGTSTLAALRGEAVSNAVNLPQATLEAPELRRLTTVAGAAGHLLSVLVSDIPQEICLHVRGEVSADVAEHVLNAALSSAFQHWLDRRVTPVNAGVVATDMNVKVGIPVIDGDEQAFPQFLFEVCGESTHTVTVTWDRPYAGIVAVDKFSLERPLAGHVLITHHHDQPGVIGTLGMILGRHGVNIAGMQVGRVAPLGEALMVTNVDDAIPPEALEEIRRCAPVEHAFVVSLPPFDADPDPVALSTITAAAIVAR